MGSPGNFDWTTEAIERLKALWAAGHSTAEIGRRMGTSKNSVISKAHRLELPARPSPIRGRGERRTPPPRTPRRKRDQSVSPPPPPQVVQPIVRVQFGPPEPLELRELRLAAERGQHDVDEGDVLPSVVGETYRRRRQLGPRTCCWPIGEPSRPGFRFCEGDPLTGKPYCTEHAALAYVRPRDRREDAA